MSSYALIFDHDGTLVDSETLHFQCWKKVMAGHGVRITEQEYIQDHNGIPTLRNAEVFLKTYGLPLNAEALANEKRAMFAEHSLLTPPPLMPTVAQTLADANDSSFHMAIATGASKEDLERSVNAHSLDNYIKQQVTRSDVAHGKPAPDVYLLACEQLGVSPEYAFAFEDTAAGVASAKAACLYCVAVPNSYSKHQNLSRADAIRTSLHSAYLHVVSLL